MLHSQVEEIGNAPGTSLAVTLAGAPPARLPWRSSFSPGAQVFYVITDGTKSEYGVGVFNGGTPSTLDRSTVIGNTSGTTARLNFTAPVRVYCAPPAQKLLYFDSTLSLGLTASILTRPTWCGTAGGTATALTLSPPQGVGTLAAGAVLRFIGGTKTTGAATVDVGDGNGAKPLRRPDGKPLGPGDILAGQIVAICYNGSEWRMAASPTSQLRVVGEVVDSAGGALPDGFIWAAGQNVLRSQYTALHALASAAGYPYGSGDGSTTFGVPDLRGRVVVGKDNMGGTAAGRVTSGNSGIAGATLGAVGGDERSQQHNHTATDAGHSHTGSASNGGHVHTYPVIGGGGGLSGPTNSATGTVRSSTGTSDPGGAHSHTFGTAIGAASISIANALAGGSQNMPPALVLNRMIYAGA